jgi:hypothetical protein
MEKRKFLSIINAEKIIFYDNDFQGAIEFKEKLKKMVDSIQRLERWSCIC